MKNRRCVRRAGRAASSGCLAKIPTSSYSPSTKRAENSRRRHAIRTTQSVLISFAGRANRGGRSQARRVSGISATLSRAQAWCRLRADERAFWCLGPASYVSHEGERPTTITWRLHHSFRPIFTRPSRSPWREAERARIDWLGIGSERSEATERPGPSIATDIPADSDLDGVCSQRRCVGQAV